MALASDNSVTYQNKLLASYFSTFEEMKPSGKYCDVTLKAGGQFFRAHRNIIAAAIPYFRTVFRSEDRKEQNDTEVDLDPDTLETFINFAYGVEIVISDENVRSLLLGAEFLQVEEIREVCCHFLEEKLCPGNVFRTRTFGERSNRTGLVERCDRYIRENFDKCSQCEEFSDLSLTYLEKLFSRDDLRVENEDKVFQAVMRWVKKSPSKRQADLPKLLANVRLTLLTPGYVQEVVNEELVRNSLICRDLLEEAKKYHLSQKKKSSLRELPRCYKDNQHSTLENVDFEGIYVVSTNRSYPSVEFYDFERRIWTNLVFKVKVDSSRFDEEHLCYGYQTASKIQKLKSLIEADNKIYVFRGKYLDELDLKTKTWRFVEQLGGRVSHDAVVKHCGNMYFCGKGESGLFCIDLFDPIKCSSTLVARASLNTVDPGLTSLGDRICILGGTVILESHCYNTNAFTTYNTNKKTWTRLPPMLTKRSGPGSAVLKDKVYVCGGYQGLDGGRVKLFLSDVEVYCTLTSKWTSIAPMFSTGNILSSVFYKGKLHVFQRSNGLLTVDLYDPRTRKFECHEVMSKWTECNEQTKAIARVKT